MTLARPSILITDDDPLARETFRDIFEPAGFKTLLAESGEEAIDIVKDQDVHLALMDMHLPKLSGLETIHIVRQIKGVIPMILISGRQRRQGNLLRKVPVGTRFLRSGKACQQERGYLRRHARAREVLLNRKAGDASRRPHASGPPPSVLCSASWFSAALGLGPFAGPRARGHDIPNAQVDRSTQVIVEPGRLSIAYEVSLSGT